MSEKWQAATRAVRAAIESDSATGAVVPPIHLSSTFAFRSFGEKGPYDYTRSGNPTRDALGDALAALEGGAGAIVTSSGMAAITAVCHLLEPGELMIAPHDCYGGTYRLFSALARKQHFNVEFIDQTDAEALRSACVRKPGIIWVETPSNPLLRIVDIRAAARLAQTHKAILVVDNTFLSPAWQQPIGLGADLVVHSTTKYLNGHSDVVGGAVIARTSELHERLVWWANCLGLTGAPFDSFLTLRGLRTLQARLAVHEQNARSLVDLLLASPVVSCVHYPGIATHPGHSVATAQQSGYGAMVSFELKGGAEAVGPFLTGLQCFSLAESLGGVESLIAHPASMTHAAMDPEARRVAGISDALLRISVGIEAAQDLRADITAGLARVASLALSATPGGRARAAC
ncbi:MAG TPA: cystathionine gamma-synthase [Steroidobacteraceae bacterium]|nr:cystathionine gamma-synthase [Steroidobacteraceae bacterium]